MTTQQTPPTIACCLCGRLTDRALDGRCLDCLAATVDVSEGIDKEYELEMCKTCAQGDIYKWFRNPQWVVMEPESAELLALCVRRVRGLKSVRLVDAAFVWTEPHARRLKVKLTVARDVLSGHALQQPFLVEFVVKTRNCDACNKTASKQDTWMAKVQVRQRCDHPRTLLAMEQQLTRRRAEMGRAPPAEVRRTKDGLDIMFARRQHAQRFVSLLHGLAPCRSKASAAVIASNAKQGTSNVKHTYAVEVAPVCRGDLVRLPRGAQPNGAVSAWALVVGVGSGLRLLDPASGRQAELSSEAYWRAPFTPVASRDRLSAFVVLDMELDVRSGGGSGGDDSAPSKPSVTAVAMADATVARESDFGANDCTFLVRTHLGGALEAGDEVMGYDVESMTHLDDGEQTADAPPVLLVEKRRERAARAAKRGSGATRRRRRKEGGRGGDGGDTSSFVSGTTYQDAVTEWDLEAIDSLALGDDGDDESIALHSLWGQVLEGDGGGAGEDAEGGGVPADNEQGNESGGEAATTAPAGGGAINMN